METLLLQWPLAPLGRVFMVTRILRLVCLSVHIVSNRQAEQEEDML